jgi:hypothetical protein
LKRQAADKAASATGRPNKRCFQIKKFFEPARVPQGGQMLSSLGWQAWAGKLGLARVGQDRKIAKQ